MKLIAPFFDTIFAAGGYFDKDMSGQTLREATVEFQKSFGYLGSVFPSSAYARADYTVLSPDQDFLSLVNFLFKQTEADFRECAASIAISISDAVVHDNVIYTGPPDNRAILYNTYRANDRPFVRPLDQATSYQRFTPRPLGGRRRVIYLGSAGSFNYGHWLVDDLPRVRFILEDRRPTTILMQSFEGANAIRLETLKMFTAGLNVEFAFIPSGVALECRELVFVTPTTHHPVIKNRGAMQFLRDLGRQRLSAVGKSRGSKLFIKRRAQRGRRLLNVDAVEAFLTSEGFIPVDPETLTFRDQVRLFSEADTIVGIMCAAMCTTVFTAPGARLTYLAPADWCEPFYWDLASTLDHHYCAVHGARAHIQDAPPADDFTIDLDMLATAIAS